MHISNHICIYDCLERSIDSTIYIREALVLNFDTLQNLPLLLTFEDTDFSDNGTGYDEIAGDGLYTSIQTYEHNVDVPFYSMTRHSVFGTVAVGRNFLHYNELYDYVPEVNDLPQKIEVNIGASINCDICTCPCSRCYCLAWVWKE